MFAWKDFIAKMNEKSCWAAGDMWMAALVAKARLVGQALRDGRQLVLQQTEARPVLGAVRPALLHDIVDLLRARFWFLENDASLNTFDDFSVLQTTVWHFSTSEDFPHQHA